MNQTLNSCAKNYLTNITIDNSMLNSFSISLLNRLNINRGGVELLGIIGTGVEVNNQQALISWLLNSSEIISLNASVGPKLLNQFSAKLYDEIDNYYLYRDYVV